MPVIKYPRLRDPLFYEWDRKAQKSGLRHTIYAVNGDQYTGEWLDNLKHGKGTQIWKSTGAIYSGDWKFGKRDGYGSYSVLDPATKEYKRVYTGWWENDRRSGRGTFFYPNGELYEGEWSNGVRSGWGKMHYKDGSTYEGQWLMDQPNGQGLLQLREYRPPSLTLPPPSCLVSCCSPRVSAIQVSVLLCSLAAGLTLPRVIPPSWAGAGGSTG
uniref:MORN repeat-containing protein 3 n=1 Tax=Geospiza parvula TaxID=87175 RepID=A0A8C3N3M5_GEOPR